MKNIAVIVTSLNSGGAERMAGLLSKELSKLYKVYLFLLSTENIVYEYGGTIVNIGKSIPLYEYAIRIYKEKYKIDVAISFLEIMNFANIRTKGREKVIISERCVQSLIDPELYGETYRIKRYYHAADRIVACSHGVRHDLIDHYDVKAPIDVIYNFVNKEKIAEKAKIDLTADVKGFLSGKDYFINVGRLHPQKNQERLIRQFAYFYENISRDYKLLILGNGELEQLLVNLIDDLGMTDMIKIIPYTDNPFPYIKNAKALILTSHYEGLPNTLLESMVLQCPIIAVDCLSGPRELLTDMEDYAIKIADLRKCERGILVPDAYSDDDLSTLFITEAMSMIVNDLEYVQVVKNNERTYMERYSNKNILNQWETLIEDCPNRDIHILPKEFELLNQAGEIVIYGAGYAGKTMYFRLSRTYHISAFVVTRKQGYEEALFGVPLMEIKDFYDKKEKPTVVIGLGENFQNEVIHNLEEHGFDKLVYPFIVPYTYDFYKNNDDWNLTSEICEWYSIATGLNIDITHPLSYNEKIQWLKIHRNSPIKSRLADKIKVREYVREKIGEKYLIPLIGVWDNFECINFMAFPDKFALKCNHASGTNIIVTDKASFDMTRARILINEWLNTDYGKYMGLELHYSDIKPRILAETLLETDDGSDLKDYKVFVFNGKVRLIQVDIDRQHNHTRNLYTPQWEYLPYSILYPAAPETIIERPKCLEEMISLAETLGEGFIHVRVDFYICNDQIYFGEMTFTHGGGIEKFTPECFGYEMGSWMNLSEGE